MSPLLRLENNHCHIEVSEDVLKKAHKYSELIILYEKKGLHQKGTLDHRHGKCVYLLQLGLIQGFTLEILKHSGICVFNVYSI